MFVERRKEGSKQAALARILTIHTVWYLFSCVVYPLALLAPEDVSRVRQLPAHPPWSGTVLGRCGSPGAQYILVL